MVTVARPEFVPDPSASTDEMKQLQRQIAEAARFEASQSIDPVPADPDATVDAGAGPVVVGVDQAFTDTQAISAIVAMRGTEIIDRVRAISPLTIDYIPGLLAFREGGPILDAFERLDLNPDLALFDGNGRLHYRQAGLATHMGVTLDLPSIGVAKRLLSGEPREAVEPSREGVRIAILADERVEAPPETVLGYAVQTRQFQDTHRVNPVYVSPGHRVTATGAADAVETLCSGYKLPDPIRVADQYADEVKMTLE